MTNTPALGGSPVAFTDDNGSQREIPLTQLFFDDNGINASNWAPYATYKAIVDPWLASLVAQGLLAPGPAPSGRAALQVTAREGGAAGNAVSVSFANPNMAAGTVDVTVQAQQVWSMLTAGTITAVLGTGAGTGSQPGLVFVVPPPPQANAKPAAGTVPAAGTPAQFAVPQQGGGTAFTLQALYSDAADAADAALLTVTVTPDGENPWFSLAVSWTKTRAGASVADLVSANPFAFLVAFAAPEGGLIGPPNAGTLTLQGGTDTPAVAAKATAFQG
jgi:hypothetical protein